jgi:hypothetical protein
MTDTQKIQLANLILEFIANNQENKTIVPKQVGVLNKTLGNNGFKLALPGTPVFDNGKRYCFMLESLDGKFNYELTFYYETLKPAIDFLESD